MKTSFAVLVLVVGAALADVFLIRCKRPICEPACDYYQTDRNGCETCQCMKDPCEDDPCPEDNACFPDLDACEGKHPCTEVPRRCVEVHKPDVDTGKCPLVMCHLDCEYGIKKNDLGCELCDCHDPCEGHECGEQETCQVVKEHDIPVAKCKARPLCHRVRDIFLVRGAPMPEPRCTDEGQFEPRQCHQTTGECWCVDDQGLEVPGTRGTEQDQCEPRKCHHAHVRMDMKHSMESIDDQLEELQKEMERQLSDVMTIESDYIDEIVLSPMGMDIVHVEFNILRKPAALNTLTEVDVATTVFHLNMRVQSGDVVIVYGENELSPIPDSWHVEHNYGSVIPPSGSQPEVPADGPLREPAGDWAEEPVTDASWSGQCYGVYRRHKIAFVAASLGIVLCMFFILYFLAVSMRKKRVIRKQKERQMRTYRENLAFTNQLYDKMVLPTNEDMEEKKPLDEMNSVSVA